MTIKTRKVIPSSIYRFLAWTTVKTGTTTKDFPLFLRTTYDLLDEKNQAVLKTHFPEIQKFVFLNQAHGDEVAVLDDPAKFDRPGFYPLPRTDGVITNIPGLMLMVMTADCLPIFLQAGEWIGLVHAGWRGTQKKIAEKALGLIHGRDVVRCAFGPCIRSCHYEVGPEFKDHFPLTQKHSKYFFDLAAENKRQLVDCGVKEDNIADCGRCTVCENDRFYSFRKEKDDAGRMVSFLCR